MVITELHIENIKGLQNFELKQSIQPNRPNILVAPNGFGKTSLAIAFKSLKNSKLDLDESSYYNGDNSNKPILILVHNYPQSIAVFFADFREDLINQLVDADAEFITERSFTEDDIDNSLFYISSFCYHFIEKKRKYVSNISLSIEDMRKYDSAIHSISQSIIYNQDTTIEKGNIIIQALKNIIMS